MLGDLLYSGVGSGVLHRLCDVVHDNDVSFTYDRDTPLGVNGNLQYETYDIVAFRIGSAAARPTRFH